MPPYIIVILDENGTIIDFESTIEPFCNDKEVIGKNWFDTFINPHDKEKIFTVFLEILQGNDKAYQTYKNDIFCKDGTHRLIDFYNRLVTKNGKKYTFSFGIEHMYLEFSDNLKKLGEKKFKESFLYS